MPTPLLLVRPPAVWRWEGAPDGAGGAPAPWQTVIEQARSLAHGFLGELEVVVCQALAEHPARHWSTACCYHGIVLALIGRGIEGIPWLEAASASAEDEPSRLLASAYQALAASWSDAEIDRRSLHALGDAVSSASLPAREIVCAQLRQAAGDHAAARRLVDDATRATDSGERVRAASEARGRMIRGSLASQAGDSATAVRLAREARIQDLGSPLSLGWSCLWGARAARSLREADLAVDLIAASRKAFLGARCFSGLSATLRCEARLERELTGAAHSMRMLRLLNEALDYDLACHSPGGLARTELERLRVYHALAQHRECVRASSRIEDQIRALVPAGSVGSHPLTVMARRACAYDSVEAGTEGSGSQGADRPLGAQVERIAATSVSVLLRGETGAGKSVLARLIHDKSRRAAGPFVHLNCAAIPDTLIEAELFGHARGAFTGATDRRPGKFELARDGSLFLDEVADLSLASQAKILHALDAGRFFPVGATEEVRVDLRILAATNQDLGALVVAGRFRQDLYYRLAGVTLLVPPLRERREEIVPLAGIMLEDIARRSGRLALAISPLAAELLIAQPWPGNLRQLHHALESAAALSDGPVIDAEVLRDVYTQHQSVAAARPGLPAAGQARAAAEEAPRPLDLSAEPLEARQERALRALAGRRMFKASEYRALAQTTTRTATRDLAQLVALGLLGSRGTGSARRYWVASRDAL